MNFLYLRSLTKDLTWRHRRYKEESIEFLGIKTKIYEIKYIPDSIKSRLDIAEINIIELEDIAIETTQN